MHAPPPIQTWPGKADMNAFYGNPDVNNDGAADLDWQAKNLTMIAAPYMMFYDGKQVRNITVHRNCADSLLWCLTAIGEEFSPADRAKYQLDQFGGVYNFRRKRGGKGLSIHSWAAAIDLAPALNAFGWTYGSRPNMMPKAVVDIFSARKWVWGGLWSKADAMHFQAAASNA